MSEIREYNLRENVRAERVEETGRIVTTNGPVDVVEGEYIVHTNQGTHRVDGAEFDAKYAPISGPDDHAPEKETDDSENPDEGSESDREGAFNPAGKTVAQVTEYMDSHPEEVDAIKRREGESNSPRKGITEYESR